MLIIPGSKEYVQFPVSGPPGVDLTQYPVETSLVRDDGTWPTVWTPASWLGGQVAALIDTTAGVTPGQYMLYGRVTTPAERPVMQSGRIRVGDTR